MTDIQKLMLSGTDDGTAILVAASATSGTTIHTAVSGGANDYDEIWLYAQNNHTADVVMTIEFGSTGGQDNIIKTITSKAGLVCIVPGLILKNGVNVMGFAATTNVISITGFVNRITVT